MNSRRKYRQSDSDKEQRLLELVSSAATATQEARAASEEAGEALDALRDEIGGTHQDLASLADQNEGGAPSNDGSSDPPE